MFGLEWLVDSAAKPDAARLASSLTAGTGRVAGSSAGSGWATAQTLSHNDPRRARAWRAIIVADQLVLFCGHLANARLLAIELGLAWPVSPSEDDLARLYGLLVRRGGIDPDLRLIGEYAAAVLDLAQGRMRLSRSPLRAPPLHYHQAGPRVIASNVPRAILAMGLDQQLDPIKLADLAWFNTATDRTRWYEGIARVPLGSVVEIDLRGSRVRSYYDPHSLPEVRLPRTEDYIEQADALLGEAVSSALEGFARPGVLLSGGLDSALVAAKALTVMPSEQRLPSFTFVPEGAWDGRTPPGTYGDERPFVDAFAAKHPRIDPHYFGNQGLGFDNRMAEMFHLTGIAPINLANMSPYHEPWRAARDAGCDVVLVPEWGNDTFSNAGNWGLVEYFLKGRWGQLGQALRALPDDPRALWRRFVGSSLLPLLPPSVWHWQRAFRGIPETRALASPLRAEFVAKYGLTQRAAAQSGSLGGPIPRTRQQWLRSAMVTVVDESNDIWQGFEQLYGVPMRDPAAYRPLAEFCWGLPTDLFLRDGQDRWLARQMGRSVLPESQRTNLRHGRHNADWLAKLAPKREALRSELIRLEQEPEFAEMLDFPRLHAALDAWPSQTPTGRDSLTLQIALTRAVTLARFINHVKGRNT